MATASFLFHGELAEFLPREKRVGAFSHACARAATIKNAIESLGVPHTESGRLTVNGQPATLSRIVRESDAIEVFPHHAADALTGEAPLFIADAHLGGLARLLRMLGFDTLFENAYTDWRILELAGRERRILLTRDRELLKCRDVYRGCFVHARKPEAQLNEVAARYALARCVRPFTLCLHCNVRLEAAEPDAVAARVPESIVARYARFARCPGCERIYWEGSHWARMRAMLGPVLAAPLPPDAMPR
ncbi:MAG: Mut7-C RNAse domain-containing protein [Burkholderiales bacterium]